MEARPVHHRGHRGAQPRNTPGGAALDPTSVTLDGGPSNGTVTIDPVTGEVTHEPTPGYVGPDSFDLEVCDVNGDCTTVTIGVNVTPNTLASRSRR